MSIEKLIDINGKPLEVGDRFQYEDSTVIRQVVEYTSNGNIKLFRPEHNDYIEIHLPFSHSVFDLVRIGSQHKFVFKE